MNAQKPRGRERILSARIFFLFVLVLILLAATSQALAAWDIYHDTDITSGTYGLIDIYDSPPDNTTVNFYGDLADYIGTHDSSTLNMYDGHADVRALDTSIINISGGTLSLAETWQYGEINISGSAEVEAIGARDFGTVDLYAGIVNRIAVLASAEINIYGGQLTQWLNVIDTGQVNVYGHDLDKTNYGGTYGYGQLYGYLMDDTYICVDLANPEAYDHINLIPEPTTLSLLILGSLILTRKKLSYHFPIARNRAVNRVN